MKATMLARFKGAFRNRTRNTVKVAFELWRVCRRQPNWKPAHAALPAPHLGVPTRPRVALQSDASWCRSSPSLPLALSSLTLPRRGRPPPSLLLLLVSLLPMLPARARAQLYGRYLFGLRCKHVQSGHPRLCFRSLDRDALMNAARPYRTYCTSAHLAR